MKSSIDLCTLSCKIPSCGFQLIGKDPGAGNDWGQEERAREERCLGGIPDPVDVSLSKLRETVRDREAGRAASTGSQGSKHGLVSEQRSRYVSPRGRWAPWTTWRGGMRGGVGGSGRRGQVHNVLTAYSQSRMAETNTTLWNKYPPI